MISSYRFLISQTRLVVNKVKILFIPMNIADAADADATFQCVSKLKQFLE